MDNWRLIVGAALCLFTGVWFWLGHAGKVREEAYSPFLLYLRLFLTTIGWLLILGYLIDFIQH